jgi:hypothetical protein
MDTKIIPNSTYTIGYISDTIGDADASWDEVTVLATLNNDTAKMDALEFWKLVNYMIGFYSSALKRDDIRAYPRQDTPDTVEV